MTTSDLREQVEERLASLSPVSRRVAFLLIDEHDRLGFHSATDLARMAGTSDATVIRTVQRLGYRGMLDLKASVAAGLAPPTPAARLDASLPDEPGATVGDGSERLVALVGSQRRSVERLATPEVRRAVESAAALIAPSRRLAVHAHGVSVGIATYAAAQFARIGLDARVLGSAAGLVGDDLHQVLAGDVVLVIASGRQPPWHDALYERCVEEGAGVVLLTDTHPSPVPDAVVVRAGRGEDAAVATHVATIGAVELILLAVAALDREAASATLDELNRHRRRLGETTALH